MDELRYQVDLLSAMNQKLENEERMYRLLCATSTSAFLYVNLLDGYIRTLGSWEQFFPEKAGLIHDSRINGQIRSLFKGLDIKLRGMTDVFPVF